MKLHLLVQGGEIAVMWDVWQCDTIRVQVNILRCRDLPGIRPGNQQLGMRPQENSEQSFPRQYWHPLLTHLFILSKLFWYLSHAFFPLRKMNFFFDCCIPKSLRVVFRFDQKTFTLPSKLLWKNILRVTIRPWPRETLESLRWRVNSTKVILFSLQHSCNVNNKTGTKSYHFVP